MLGVLLLHTYNPLADAVPAIQTLLLLIAANQLSRDYASRA